MHVHTIKAPVKFVWQKPFYHDDLIVSCNNFFSFSPLSFSVLIFFCLHLSRPFHYCFHFVQIATTINYYYLKESGPQCVHSLRIFLCFLALTHFPGLMFRSVFICYLIISLHWWYIWNKIVCPFSAVISFSLIFYVRAAFTQKQMVFFARLPWFVSSRAKREKQNAIRVL